MTTNADRTRDVLLNNFDNATAEIARIMDAKDQVIDNLIRRVAELQKQIDEMEDVMVSNGLPI